MINDVLRRQKFWRRVVVECEKEGEKEGGKDGELVGKKDGGCWLWTGTSTRRGGYGHIKVDGKLVKVHRYAWELLRGPIPEGHELFRLCENKSCVNPDHMVLVRRKGLAFDKRFWKWVSRGGFGDDDCWEWIGGINHFGYGMFRWRDTHLSAHRVAWELTHRVMLKSDQILYHVCGNRRCVRPSHLSLEYVRRKQLLTKTGPNNDNQCQHI